MITLQVIQSLGILACVVLVGGFAAAIPAARTHDAHMLHQPGTCPDCDES